MHCEKCNYTTAFTKDWNKHLLTSKHINPIVVKRCNLCNYTTTEKSKFKDHINNQVHLLLKILNPINYMDIVLDKIDINFRRVSRETILTKMKLLNEKQIFMFKRGSWLYVYTTEWKRYANTDENDNIEDQLFIIYKYFEDYFVPKLNHDNLWNYKRAIDNGDGQTPNRYGRREGITGQPITKKDILNYIPIFNTFTLGGKPIYKYLDMD